MLNADPGPDDFGVFGAIGTHTTLAAFADGIAATSGPVPIRSAGGSFSDALAMARLIEKHQAATFAVYAGSAAVLPLVAGSGRTLSANGWVLIHAPWTMAAGPADRLRRITAHLERTAAAIAEFVAARSRVDEKNVFEWMESETFLSADQALKHGLIDQIGPPSEIRQPAAVVSVELAAAQRQIAAAADAAAERPETGGRRAVAMAQAMLTYTAPAFENWLAGRESLPTPWPTTAATRSAAALCHTDTKAALLAWTQRNEPMPDAWQGRWKCPSCALTNWHAPTTATGQAASCLACKFKFTKTDEGEERK